jgi:Na+-transporting methylmalonyl-CoA/oxaloacetate decarboxylase gamma subunit
MKKQVLMVMLVLAVAILGVSYAIGQEKAKEEAKPKEAAEFKIDQLVVGTGVENLEPAGVAETFPATEEKVYCFLKATEIAKDTEVTLVWYQGQKELRKKTLPLKQGSKWRTFDWKNLNGLKGEWKVELKDAAGNVVKDIKFKVE